MSFHHTSHHTTITLAAIAIPPTHPPPFYLHLHYEKIPLHAVITSRMFTWNSLVHLPTCTSPSPFTWRPGVPSTPGDYHNGDTPHSRPRHWWLYSLTRTKPPKADPEEGGERGGGTREGEVRERKWLECLQGKEIWRGEIRRWRGENEEKIDG